MSNLEIQIKNIENNIVLKEKKRKVLEKEIKELKNVSDKLYDELIKQEEILFKIKMKNIEWDLKINNLKRENLKTQKQIEQTNTLLHFDFHDFKNKKKETKQNQNKLEEIIALINNEHSKQKKEDNKYQTFLQTLLKNKKKHNNNLQTFLIKKNEKVSIIQNKIKTIETDTFSLYQEIGILNEELIYNINKIKYFIHQAINKFTLKGHQLTSDTSILCTCLHIISNIGDKENQQIQLFNEKFKNMYNKKNKEALCQPDDSNTNEMNIRLGTNTQEFLEL